MASNEATRLLSALDAWQAMLQELDDLEVRAAVAASRLPVEDPDIIDLRYALAERRALVIEVCARLRQAAALLAPATRH